MIAASITMALVERLQSGAAAWRRSDRRERPADP